MFYYNVAMGESTGGEFLDREFMRRLERLRLATKSTRLSRAGGVLRSGRMGDGLEFADHRAYSPGDDIRFMDWAYYARMERFLLRLFHEHSEAPVSILTDTSASMASGGAEKFDYARRLTAALAYLAAGGLRRVTVTTFTDRPRMTFRMGRDRRKIFSLLERLAGIRPGGATDLGRAVEIFARRQSRPGRIYGGGGTVFVISDLLDCPDVASVNEAIARLKHVGCDVVVIHVFDRADAHGPRAGAAVLQHAESGDRLKLHLGDEVLRAYRRGWMEFCDRLRRVCLRNRAVYVPAGAEAPLEELVFVTLRRSGILTG